MNRRRWLWGACVWVACAQAPLAGGEGARTQGSVVRPFVRQMRVGPVASTGLCVTRDLERLVRLRAGDIRACYQRRLDADPTLRAGELALSWTIGSDGRVEGVERTTDTLGDRVVSDCATAIVAAMAFLAPAQGSCAVTCPFWFEDPR